MGCTWASKVNGILTVLTIGIAVLVDLWDELDVKKNETMVRFTSVPRSLVTQNASGTILETFHG